MLHVEITQADDYRFTGIEVEGVISDYMGDPVVLDLKVFVYDQFLEDWLDVTAIYQNNKKYLDKVTELLYEKYLNKLKIYSKQNKERESDGGLYENE